MQECQVKHYLAASTDKAYLWKELHEDSLPEIAKTGDNSSVNIIFFVLRIIL